MMDPDPATPQTTPSPGENDPSDDQLVAALLGGDRKAFSQLYDRHAPHVYTVAKRILRSSVDAESVVSDVFYKLWRSPGSFDPSRSSCRTYLIVVARSRAIDRLRSSQLHRDHTLAAADEEFVTRSPAATPEEQVVLDEDRRAVRDAVGSLTDEQSDAIRMAFFRGMTHDEIAAELKQPLGTIKSRIRAGLRVLQSRLASIRRHDDAP